MSEAADPRGLLGFLATALALLVLRVVFGVVAVPVGVSVALNVVSAVVFVAGPLFALFSGAAHPWKIPSSLVALGVGAAVQVGAGVAAKQLHLTGLPSVALQASAQTGLLVWCLGLGTLVAQLVKEKNLVLPIAVFLAGFDVFLVLTPYAPTAAIVEQRPEVFQSVAASVPKAQTATPAAPPKEAKVETLAYVGPADFLFSTVFFALVFRFGMKARRTLAWLAGVLVLYLAAVLMPFGLGMLPALVPIGATILLVNRDQFDLTRDERQATWGVVVVAVLLASFGLYQRINYKAKPKPPVAPASQPAAPEPAGQAATLGPAPAG